MTAEDPQSKINDFWNTVATGYEEHAGNVAAPGTPEYEAWTEAIRKALPAGAKRRAGHRDGNGVCRTDRGRAGAPGDGDRPCAEDAGRSPPQRRSEGPECDVRH